MMDHRAANHSIRIQLLFGECANSSDAFVVGASRGRVRVVDCLFTCHDLPFRYAIKGSPTQKLLLEDIYYAIESRVRIPCVVSMAVY